MKSNARSIPYDQLYRNISEYEGEYVTYRGRISDMQSDNGSFEFIVALPNDEAFGSDYLWILWDGDPFKEDDEIVLWGEVTGTHTYDSLAGEKTVPEVRAHYIELAEDVVEPVESATTIPDHSNNPRARR